MSNKNIFLYFPEFSFIKTGASTLHRIPYATLNLAGPLRDAGYNVKLFDARVDNASILEPYIRSNPLFIGITSLTGQQLRGAASFAKLVRKTNPKVPIVWGGWHASLLPEELAKEEYVDIVAKGQFEHRIVNLAQDIGSGEKSCPSVIWKTLDGNIDTGPSTIQEKFSRIAFDMLDLDKYGPYTGYVTSFGCPLKCRFCCMPPISQRKFVFREVDHVIEDLSYLVTHRKTIVQLNVDDDNFFIKPERVIEFCEKWIKTGLNRVPISLLVHIRAALSYDDDIYKLMAQAGIKYLLIGAESGNQIVLDRLDKHQTPDDILKFVEKITKFGMVPDLSCMTGFPDSEELGDFKDTVMMAQKAGTINPFTLFKLFWVRPYPGSPLFDEFKAQGWKMPSNVKEWQDYTLRYAPAWVSRDIEEQVNFFLAVFLPKYGWNFTWDKFIDEFWKARERDDIPRQKGM